MAFDSIQCAGVSLCEMAMLLSYSRVSHVRDRRRELNDGSRTDALMAGTVIEEDSYVL